MSETKKRSSASTQGSGNAGFTFSCGGFEKASQMMGEFCKGEKGSIGWEGMMRKFCGDKRGTFDCGEMMNKMCGQEPEKPIRK